MIMKLELREDKMGISFVFLTSVLISGTTGCTDPGTPANGVRHPSESTSTGLFPADTVLHFSCSEGYLLDGPPKVICTKTGTWLPKPNPSCIAVNPCSTNPCQNGATCVDNMSSATGYYCHCPPVYHGNQCEQRMDCELPHDDEVPNSHYEVHGQESDSAGWYLPAATLVYKCYTGYTMRGSHHSRQCENGRWVGEKPECVKQLLCEDPGRPDHTIRCCQNIFNAGVRLSFFCEEGYELSGSDERTCQTDGMWSGVQPSCNKVTTEPTPDSNTLNTETLTIITATTGSILGILVVTVILTSRQCRSHRHRAHRNYPPALQARLARLRQDPDATALLAVTNNIDVVLPSYDEAMAPPVRTIPPPFEAPSIDNDDQSQISGSENRSSVQGRPLPPLPPPNHGRPSRSRRSRGRRSSRSAEAEPLPPPYRVEPDDGATGAPPVGNGTEADRGEVTHSMMGNDLYAEVNQRRDGPREDGEQNAVDNSENIHDCEEY